MKLVFFFFLSYVEIENHVLRWTVWPSRQNGVLTINLIEFLSHDLII
jgi:hypothetical protein